MNSGEDTTPASVQERLRAEKPLVRRASKLSKQDVVESEEPPPQQKKEKTQLQVKIPETKVESFDLIDDNQLSPPAKSKTLIRSHAMCGDDDTKLSARALEKQGSSKTSLSSCGSSLSRESSAELYTDSTGINLEEFICRTLHKNAKDRKALMDIERDLTAFVQNEEVQVHRFSQMSSYNRMLVHRVAAFFGLDHNVDQSGTAVVVTKNPSTTRMPEFTFEHYIQDDMFTEEPKQKQLSLLRRDNASSSYEESGGMYLTVTRHANSPQQDRRARSFEEREIEYSRVKARIFHNQDSSSSAEGVIESPMSDALLRTGVTQLGARPWSSTDSSSEGCGALQRSQQLLIQQKAGSFGGMPEVYRAGASKMSPRRSNTECANESYPSSVPVNHQPSRADGQLIGHHAGAVAGQSVICQVPVEHVPPGAYILSPHTGQPLLNADGTIYRHNPAFGPQAVSTLLQTVHQDPNLLSAPMQMMSFSPTQQGLAAPPANAGGGSPASDAGSSVTDMPPQLPPAYMHAPAPAMYYMVPSPSGDSAQAASSQPTMFLPGPLVVQTGTSLQYTMPPIHIYGSPSAAAAQAHATAVYTASPPGAQVAAHPVSPPVFHPVFYQHGGAMYAGMPSASHLMSGVGPYAAAMMAPVPCTDVPLTTEPNDDRSSTVPSHASADSAGADCSYEACLPYTPPQPIATLPPHAFAPPCVSPNIAPDPRTNSRKNNDDAK